MGNATSVTRICDYVKDQIGAKLLFPGNRVAEEELAHAMNTSRTTVRSAIQRLNYEGLVEIVPNYGAFVVKPTVNDIKQAYLVRTALETEAVRLASGRMSKHALDRMNKSMELQTELCGHFSMSEYVNLNRDFHWEIVKAADNVYLEKYLNELLNKMVIYLMFYDTSVDNSKSLLRHARLLEALEKGEPEKAVDALKDDILLGNALF